MIFMSEVGAIVYGVCTISTCITRAVLFCYLSIGVKELLTTCSIGTCGTGHILVAPTNPTAVIIATNTNIAFTSLVTQNSNKHLWIKKATGLGISEFMLRFMAWLCLKDNALSGEVSNMLKACLSIVSNAERHIWYCSGKYSVVYSQLVHPGNTNKLME